MTAPLPANVPPIDHAYSGTELTAQLGGNINDPGTAVYLWLRVQPPVSDAATLDRVEQAARYWNAYLRRNYQLQFAEGSFGIEIDAARFAVLRTHLVPA